MLFKTTYLLPCVFFLTISIVYGDDCTVSDYNLVVPAIQKCATLNIKDMTVPANTTLLFNLNKGTKLTFVGRLTFEPAQSERFLMTIMGDNLTIEGHNGHVIDGQGDKYWHGHTADKRPFLLSIEATNSDVKYLHLLNCPGHCVVIERSKNLYLSHFFIDNRAGDPGVRPVGYEAKNTDGFDITTSENVVIEHSTIYNQDDCVAINDGYNYIINDLECHGSHGLSISVAFGNNTLEEATVKNVLFKNSHMIGCNEGIHLKNHITGGPGLIEDVTYKNITLKDILLRGIHIQENYPKGEATSNVLMKNLKISDVYAIHNWLHCVYLQTNVGIGNKHAMPVV